MKEKSKYLSYLLRHKPEQAGLTLTGEGWVLLQELVDNAGFTFEELEEIVRTDNKGRYTIDGPRIRANQGHSTTQVNLTFERAVPPTVLYHGTSHQNYASVMKQGLKPMNRHHVHMSASPDVAYDVGGRRKGEVVVFEIDTKRMLADGIQFYRSTNNVWLVDHVPPKYMKELQQ